MVLVKAKAKKRSGHADDDPDSPTRRQPTKDDVERIIDSVLTDLYSESGKERLSAVDCVVDILGEKEFPFERIFKEKQLMSALTRLLGDNSCSDELAYNITKVFAALSQIDENHDRLAENRIGALAISVLEFQVKRHNSRGGVAFSDEQECLITLCLDILNNLGDSPLVLPEQDDEEGSAVAARAETAATLSAEGCQVIPFLASVIDNTDVREIQVDVVCTLFNLSFHDPCLEMISRTDIWESLTVLVRDRCNQAVSLMYRLSSTEANREYMTEIGLAALVGELVNDFAPSGFMDVSLAGLLVNMSLNPLFCEDLIALNAVEGLLGIIDSTYKVDHVDSKSNIQYLVRVLRHLAAWTRMVQLKIKLLLSDDQHSGNITDVVQDASMYIYVTSDKMISLYCDHNFWSLHVETVIREVLSAHNDECLLYEWLGLIGNLTQDDLPAGCSIRTRDEEGAEASVDLQLEVVVWLGELCRSSDECSHWIAASGLVDTMHMLLRHNSQCVEKEDELLLQILVSYESFLAFEATRLPVLGGGESVIRSIANCLSAEDEELRLAAGRLLLVIEDLDRDERGVSGDIGKAVRDARFKALVGEVQSNQ
ncbi:hypothetical protein THAOC_22186 [Thalassiosira oceanica]|uniref:Uncharacterized protein n=1 Tax=Thalassiosira oceanica TaxID=159749 RepID=K0RVB8_THAOC|nr:hypothetical protein THAOC_22186 [Thalassiosira oceanica]|eukprot:EJK57738.1 hypothetical protein THAOC_22186 [Thalassiosira oceanica]